MTKTYYIYIMTNTTNTVVYIGVTNDLLRRTAEHIDGTVDGFSQKYKTCKLVYFEEYHEINCAIQREKQLKHWTRAKKNALVDALNPEWNDLRPLL